jgi:penicillin-binding protein 1A
MSDLPFGLDPLPHGAPGDFGDFTKSTAQTVPNYPTLDDPVAPPLLPSTRPERSDWGRRWYWMKRGLAAAFLIGVILFAWLAITAPLSKSLEPISPPRLMLLAADGQPIARNGAVIDQPVKAALLPAHVKNAFLAIEDRRFYAHWGVDPRGLARAAWNNVRGGGKQGGSTITQQLAKITFLTPERSMTRKAREMLIAFWLEGWLTKDQILERYLSNVYFGDNVYGLRAASLHYFFRQPERLTLPQSALLAGLVQAPSRLAPTHNPIAAHKRAKMVINAMADAGFITSARAQSTEPASLDVRTSNALPTGTYFADWALPQAREVADATYGEQKITTTLDARLQRIARSVINQAPLDSAQVALVAMRQNGEVVAMLGGRNYDKSTFNRATQARRQPGSTFKLFVYLAALRSGMTPDSLIDDSPITDGTYQPKNSHERYHGKITLRQAFARSSNVAAVRLYKLLGDKAIIRAARDLGIKSPLNADPTLALGSSGVTLLELTSAFAGVASNNWPITPHAMPEDEPGFLGSILSGKRHFADITHVQMMDLLASVVTQGTGQSAKLRIKSYGKTGTSQENRDALFVGFAGDLVVGVWIGNDDNSPLKGVFGGGLPARIWRDFIGQAIKGAALVRPVSKPKEKPPVDLPFDFGNSGIEIGNDNSVTLNTNIGGVNLDVKLGQDGIAVTPRDEK